MLVTRVHTDYALYDLATEMYLNRSLGRLKWRNTCNMVFSGDAITLMSTCLRDIDNHNLWWSVDLPEERLAGLNTKLLEKVSGIIQRDPNLNIVVVEARMLPQSTGGPYYEGNFVNSFKLL